MMEKGCFVYHCIYSTQWDYPFNKYWLNEWTEGVKEYILGNGILYTGWKWMNHAVTWMNPGYIILRRNNKYSKLSIA